MPDHSKIKFTMNNKLEFIIICYLLHLHDGNKLYCFNCCCSNIM